MAGPVRRCLACRRAAPQARLVRLVTDRGAVVADVGGPRRPGRGAYLCGSTGCTEAALRGDAGRLRRALRTAADVRVDGPTLVAALANTPETPGTTTMTADRDRSASPTTAGDRQE